MVNMKMDEGFKALKKMIRATRSILKKADKVIIERGLNKAQEFSLHYQVALYHMTKVVKILKEHGKTDKEVSEYIDGLCKCSMIVTDDIGVNS